MQDLFVPTHSIPSRHDEIGFVLDIETVLSSLVSTLYRIPVASEVVHTHIQVEVEVHCLFLLGSVNETLM